MRVPKTVDCLTVFNKLQGQNIGYASDHQISDRIGSDQTQLWFGNTVVRSTGQKTKNRGNFDRISILDTVTAHTHHTYSPVGTRSCFILCDEKRRAEDREGEKRREEPSLSSHLIPYWTVHFYSTTHMLKLSQTGLNRYDCDSIFCCR